MSVSHTKCVVITGASSGIGLASAQKLAEDGHELVLAGRRLGLLQELATQISLEGGVAHPIALDLSDPESVNEFIGKARKTCGDGFPVLINAAGIAEFGDFTKMDLEKIDLQLQINLTAPIHLCHAALPWMLEHGGGQIVNVLSVVASQVFAGTAVYSASKAGLHMFGKAIAAEYRRKGIRVTSLLPGAVNTPIWDGMAGAPDREKMIPVDGIATAIHDIVNMPHDRNVDEMLIMPPTGIL